MHVRSFHPVLRAATAGLVAGIALAGCSSGGSSAGGSSASSTASGSATGAPSGPSSTRSATSRPPASSTSSSPGKSPTSSTSATRPPASTSADTQGGGLAAKFPSKGDLPSGWVIAKARVRSGPSTNAGNSGTEPKTDKPACTAAFKTLDASAKTYGAKQKEDGSTDLTGPKGAKLSMELIRYDDLTAANFARQVGDGLSACYGATATLQGTTLNFAKPDVDSAGDDFSGFATTGTSGGATRTQRLVFARQGDTIVTLTDVAAGASKDDFSKIFAAAIASAG